MPPDDHAERHWLPHEPTIPRDVKKALDLMRASVGGQLTVAGLAASCGVPENTLRKHFRHFVGLSPMAHLRRLRLAAARTELLACEGLRSVTEIATRYGFAHLGRFAADYARCFGEPPSATRARGLREAEDREQDRRREEAARTLAEAGDACMHRPYLGRHAPTLLIVPFHGVSGRDQAQFAADLAAQLAAALSRLHGIAVVRATPAPNGGRDWRHEARHCAASYCLAGQIANAGERIRVVVQLFDTATGAHLWGDCYDGHVREPLTLLDRIAADVPDSVASGIRQGAIARASRKRPGSSTADDLVLRAMPFMVGPALGNRYRAFDLLDQAMAMDPDHALAPALAAYGHARAFRNGLFAGKSAAALMEPRARALQLAARAAALDTIGDPLVLTLRAVIARLQGDGEQTDALLARAVAIDPTTALAWELIGGQCSFCGRHDAAIMAFSRAIRLDGPDTKNMGPVVGIGSTHFMAGRYADAALWFRRALAAAPNDTWINQMLAPTNVLLGEKRAARGALDALRREYPGATVASYAAYMANLAPTVPANAACRERTLEALASIGLPP